LSDSAKDPLPQDAFRNVPFTDEDAYFAEQEKITLQRLKKERETRSDEQRHCLNSACGNTVMDVVQVDNVEIDRCPKCGGVWLDAGELEVLMKRAKGSKNGLMRFFYNLAGQYDE